MAIRIMVFSNVRLFCETLTDCLTGNDGVGEVIPCYIATQLHELLVEKSSDVVLFDAADEQTLPELKALSDMALGTRILAMGVPEVPEKVLACAEAGVDGYIPKQCSVKDLLVKIEMALKGEYLCHPKIVRHLFRELHHRGQGEWVEAHEPPAAHDPPEPLTHRECEVLRLVARGLSNKEVARELVLSVATVKNHLHNIFGKLRVKGRLAVLARLRNESWLIRAA